MGASLNNAWRILRASYAPGEIAARVALALVAVAILYGAGVAFLLLEPGT